MIHPQQAPFAPARRSFTEVDRDEIVRQTITEIELRMNGVNVNHTYQQAFKVVIKILRGMKP